MSNTGFYIFAFIFGVMLPLLMIFMGRVFEKKPPKSINYIYGFRTTMSMKNTKTWEYAHKRCGILWKKIGIILLIVTIATNLVCIPFINTKDSIGIILLIVMAVQLFMLIATVFFVEKELKAKFDKNGIMREDVK